MVCDRSRRRGTDHLERAVARLVAVLAVMLVPWAGQLGFEVYTDATQQVQAEAPDRAPAVAVLLQDASGPLPGHLSAARITRALATWTDAGAIRHQGQVPVAVNTPAGTVVQVWLDGHGQLASPPLNRRGPLYAGVVTAVGVLLFGGAALAGLWAGLCWLTLSWNLRAWEREWAQIDPRQDSSQSG